MASGHPLRGQIWLASFDPAVGTEIRKTRPALLISNNINNQYAGTVTVLPISEKGEKVYPFEVSLDVEHTGLSKPSKIKCQQIRTVDKSRLTKLLGSISRDKMPEVEQALRIHLAIE